MQDKNFETLKSYKENKFKLAKICKDPYDVIE